MDEAFKKVYVISAIALIITLTIGLAITFTGVAIKVYGDYLEVTHACG